jgi:hypothetical protein
MGEAVAPGLRIPNADCGAPGNGSGGKRGTAARVDIHAIFRKMESRLAEIRREHPSWAVPARRPVGPAGGRKPFMQWLAEMSPQEVAALPPQKREMRRRWLEGNAVRGEVRTTKAN